MAVGLDHQLIEPEHVLVALLDQEGGSIRHLLTRAGVKVNALRSQLGERLDALPKVSGAEGEVTLSNDTIKILTVTDKLATKSARYGRTPQEPTYATVPRRLYSTRSLGSMSHALYDVGGEYRRNM